MPLDKHCGAGWHPGPALPEGFPGGFHDAMLLRTNTQEQSCTPAREAVIVTMFLISAAAGAFLWTSLHWPYSVGQRAGYMQKLSHKGNACKTWEGELVMATVPGAVAYRFEFSVPTDAVAARLNATLGRRVALQYEQHELGSAPVWVSPSTS
jgi:hypothetical protein